MLADGHILAICGAAKMGQAPMIFTPELLSMTRQYQRDVRLHLDNSTTAGLESEKPSLTDIRKCVTTKSATLFHDDPALRGLVNVFLCHSDQVAKELIYKASGRPSELGAGFDAVRQTFLSN